MAFAIVALLLTLALGLVLGMVSAAGHGRSDRLVQAHGWVQLEGWLGLFVAGMGLRLMPRLAGRRPLPSRLTVSVLVLLTAGVLLRAFAQVFFPGAATHVALECAGALSALGAGVLAAGLAVALTGRGRSWRPWRLAAWAGTTWWVAWGVVVAVGAFRSRDGVVPASLDQAAVWIALLGWSSNFIWAVQSRSVPVFYGRPQPGLGTLGPPLLILNAGTALVFLSAFGLPTALPGLGLAGVATAWLAPVAGSIGGTAHRLRPPSRPAARFVVVANLWAIVAGVLLGGAAIAGFVNRANTDAITDAAVHAAGLGFATILIVGMSQLLMPAFAGERIDRRKPGPESWLSLPALTLATVLRVGSVLLAGQLQTLVIGSSGVLAWIGLAAFAAGMIRAATASPGMRPR